jgi:hypothetical protein
VVDPPHAGFRDRVRNMLHLPAADARNDAGVRPPAPRYIDCAGLAAVLPSGREAEARSGLLPAHIEVLKAVAAGLDTVLAFRTVNPESRFWMQYGRLPMKGLNVKDKSLRNDGPLGGLIEAPGERNDSTVSLLDAAPLALRIRDYVDSERLQLLEVGGTTPAGHWTIGVRDVERDRTYRFELDEARRKFSVGRKEGDAYKRVRFRGVHGVPLTADYDAFDFYPRLKPNAFAGYKDLHGLFVKRLDERDPSCPKARRRWVALIETVINDVLELPAVRQPTADRGRLTPTDSRIIDAINAGIHASGYPHDAVMHGKEKWNIHFPERCESVLFILPDGGTLCSTNWNETQAVDYALQQAGYITTVNRAYNRPAGDPRHRESSRVIPWDSRAAAEELHDAVAAGAAERADGSRRGTRQESAIAKRLREKLKAAVSRRRRAAADTDPDAAADAAPAVSNPADAATPSAAGRPSTAPATGPAGDFSRRRLSWPSEGNAPVRGRSTSVSSASSAATWQSGVSACSASSRASTQSIPDWLLAIARAAAEEPDEGGGATAPERAPGHATEWKEPGPGAARRGGAVTGGGHWRFASIDEMLGHSP